MVVTLPDRELHVATEAFHFVEYYLVFFNWADAVVVSMKSPDR